MSDFMTKCLNGDVMMDEIDDFIDDWHENPRNLELHQFLGMKEDEFQIWLSEADLLPYIIHARKTGKSIEDTLREEGSLPLAARGNSASRITDIVNWLHKHNYLD